MNRMNLSTAWKGLLLAAVLCVSSAQAADVRATDVRATDKDELTKMFEWWNTAFKSPEGFTEAAFAGYFTPDAALVINGVEEARGLPAWVQHFRKIQATGADVEIVVPFRHVFKQGDKIYTYHVIRSRRNGAPGCMLAAGHAFLEKGRISEVNLVRAALDPAQAAKDPACWKK